MSTAESDEFDFEDSAVSDVTLKELSDLGNELLAAQDAVDEIETILFNAKQKLHHLKSRIIPDALAQAGVPFIGLDDGRMIEIDDFVSGSIPKDPGKKEIALTELHRIGGDPLLRTTVTLSFRKNEHNLALDTIAALKENGLNPDIEFGVHAQTLQAFGRELLEKGDDFDAAKLGLFVGRIAKIKETPKAKAKSRRRGKG